MTGYKVWDPAVRVFHWALVAGFALNALVLDPESTAHERIGYAVVALVALRLVWGMVGTRYARFASFPPSLRAAAGQLREMLSGARHVHLGHTPLGALMIYNLLAVMVVIGATGWLMTTDAFWGADWVEEAHEAAVTWAEISILLHVLAVLWESRRTGVNLPRAMMTGVKRVPDGANCDP